MINREQILPLLYRIAYRMKTTSVTDFRANIKKYLDAVILDYDSVVINRGNTGAVLISLEEYNSIKGTERVMASDGIKSAISSGRADFENGNFVEVDIDSL